MDCFEGEILSSNEDKAIVRPHDRGDIRIRKGFLDGMPVNIWDKVRQCKFEKCPLWNDCPYYKVDGIDRSRKTSCLVEHKYVSENLKPFMELFKRIPDPFVLQFVGMHIIPMYVDLVQLKVDKLKLKDYWYTDIKGVIKAHPILDQILRTHNSILDAWRKVDLIKIAREAGFFSTGKRILPDTDDIDLSDTGDPDEYAAMADMDG